jgi:hypothetical protein
MDILSHFQPVPMRFAPDEEERRDRRIFVGGLSSPEVCSVVNVIQSPVQITESLLQQYFELKFGRVVDVHIATDSATGISKGLVVCLPDIPAHHSSFGFVTFELKASQERALAQVCHVCRSHSVLIAPLSPDLVEQGPLPVWLHAERGPCTAQDNQREETGPSRSTPIAPDSRQRHSAPTLRRPCVHLHCLSCSRTEFQTQLLQPRLCQYYSATGAFLVLLCL